MTKTYPQTKFVKKYVEDPFMAQAVRSDPFKIYNKVHSSFSLLDIYNSVTFITYYIKSVYK